MDPMQQVEQAIAAEIEKMKAAGKSPQEMSAYVANAMKQFQDAITSNMKTMTDTITKKFGGGAPAAPGGMPGAQSEGDMAAMQGGGFQSIIDDPNEFRAVPPGEGETWMHDPNQPDYTGAKPQGSMRGKPYPTEEEFGGGDEFYSQVYRWEQDNGAPPWEEGSNDGGPAYRKFVDEYARNGSAPRSGGRPQQPQAAPGRRGDPLGVDDLDAAMGQTPRSAVDFNSPAYKKFIKEYDDELRAGGMTPESDPQGYRAAMDEAYMHFPAYKQSIQPKRSMIGPPR